MRAKLLNSLTEKEKKGDLAPENPKSQPQISPWKAIPDFHELPGNFAAIYNGNKTSSRTCIENMGI